MAYATDLKSGDSKPADASAPGDDKTPKLLQRGVEQYSWQNGIKSLGNKKFPIEQLWYNDYKAITKNISDSVTGDTSWLRDALAAILATWTEVKVAPALNGEFQEAMSAGIYFKNKDFPIVSSGKAEKATIAHAKILCPTEEQLKEFATENTSTDKPKSSYENLRGPIKSTDIGPGRKVPSNWTKKTDKQV